MAENPYRILGVTPSASPSEVKGAYRRRVRGCHPDSVGAGHEDEFHRVQEAYEALQTSGPARRFDNTTPRRSQSQRQGHARGSGNTPAACFDVELSQAEAWRGLRVAVPVVVSTPCLRCAGSMILRVLCMRCGGRGSVSKRGILTAEVPPGVVSGDTIRTDAFVDTLGEVEVEFRVIVAR